jgi:uncharacterized protein YecE (DUF72 family)
MAAKKQAQFFAGTSNVVMPGNKQSFPVEFRSRTRLHYYATMFNSVEINQTFYKLPLTATCEKWAADVPADFRFTLKLSKEITHAKELKGDLSTIDSFFRMAEGIGVKRGCILVQFPGKISLEYFSQVEQILETMQQQDPNNEWYKAIEFRNASWYVGETWELLNEFSAAVVLQDHPKAKLFEPATKATFVYLRFHGPEGNYRDSYTSDFLQKRSNDIKRWMSEGKDVYAYFNNTIGSAFENARTLQQLVAR